MGRIRGMRHKSDLRQSVLTTFFTELQLHKCIWGPKQPNNSELYEARTEAWSMILETLKSTYSMEILEVMKMTNLDGLKSHYRCHKDKRAKTVKTMAQMTDPQRLVRLQSCLDKRLNFLDAPDDGSNPLDACSYLHANKDAAIAPPSKVLVLDDFNDSPKPVDVKPLLVPTYDANKISQGEDAIGRISSDFLDDFVATDGGILPPGPRDRIDHFFEFLKAEVRELPKNRQTMLMDSFFVQLTEARRW